MSLSVSIARHYLCILLMTMTNDDDNDDDSDSDSDSDSDGDSDSDTVDFELQSCTSLCAEISEFLPKKVEARQKIMKRIFN